MKKVLSAIVGVLGAAALIGSVTGYADYVTYQTQSALPEPEELESMVTDEIIPLDTDVDGNGFYLYPSGALVYSEVLSDVVVNWGTETTTTTSVSSTTADNGVDVATSITTLDTEDGVDVATSITTLDTEDEVDVATSITTLDTEDEVDAVTGTTIHGDKGMDPFTTLGTKEGETIKSTTKVVSNCPKTGETLAWSGIAIGLAMTIGIVLAIVKKRK